MKTNIEPCKILAVDDDQDILGLLARKLELHGFEVETATTTAEGMEKIRNGNFALVLLDIVLGSESGIEMCKAIRTESHKKYIPIIFITAQDGTRNIVSGLDAGADDYIVKPFVFEELYARIKSALRLNIAQEKLRQASNFKNDIMSAAGHDMKNILAIIRDTARQLQNEADTAEKRRLLTVRLQESADTMNGMITRFIQKGRLLDTDTPIKKIMLDPAHITKACFRQMLPVADSKKIKLVETNCLPGNYHLNADPNLLEEITFNLISNAIKNTPPMGEISLTMKKDNGFFEMTVSDGGAGLPVEEQEQLMDSSGYMSGRTEAHHGIALIRQFTELHGGMIELRNSPDKGSTFRIMLPEN